MSDDRIAEASGPLKGVKIVEIAGLGPAPFASMVLADMGADILRIDRADRVFGQFDGPPPPTLWDRSRRSVGVDLKNGDGVATILRLVESADVFIEGFRPGVAERLGLGPDECLARNPKLVYGRMTGWGQDGPYASTAGHDINYIALAGVLGAIGRAGEAPVPPLNLVGDFGGGGMLLALGVVAALFEAGRSGKGQVIDAAMVDGSAQLMNMIWGMAALGTWEPARGVNALDTGAHFYDVFETSDGGYVSIGSIEPQFYARLLALTGLDGEADLASQQNDRTQWPAFKERLAAVFRSKTRAEWCSIMEGTDVCFAPVLSMAEAAAHPHNQARQTFVEVAGVTQPAPAPRFSRTPSAVQRPPSWPGRHTDDALADWGFRPDEIAKLRETGAVR
jgi:alpha-methylacyl-CoA racemase